MKGWLGECRVNHKFCPSAVPRTLPKILVNVSNPDDHHVRLCTNVKSNPEYTALSYCWGTTGTVVTQSANLAEFSVSISVLSLPQTLQDGIRVTRSLGFQYLWVDALVGQCYARTLQS